MVPVLISVEEADVTVVDAMVVSKDVRARAANADRMTGGNEFATVLVALTPFVLDAIVKILKDKWVRNGKVSIEARGVKIKGASPEDIERILEKILERTDEDE